MRHAKIESPSSRAGGDTDIASVGALVADAGRCQILLALDEGRALPASRLAAEAGVSAATASSHLKKLTESGLLTVEAHGRNRYYRLAGPGVGRLIEALQELASHRRRRHLRSFACRARPSHRLRPRRRLQADRERHRVRRRIRSAGRTAAETGARLRRLERAATSPSRSTRARSARPLHRAEVDPPIRPHPRGPDHRRRPCGAERHVRRLPALTSTPRVRQRAASRDVTDSEQARDRAGVHWSSTRTAIDQTSIDVTDVSPRRHT